MQNTLISSIFPELLKLSDHSLDVSEFSQLPYFRYYRNLLNQKQLRTKAQKCKDYFKLIKIKKGTIIYGYEDPAEKGYILLSGCVEILRRKNIRQKAQKFPGHFLHGLPQKIKYLNQNYKIPEDKAQNFISMFYEQKIEFRYLPSHRIISQEEFGFGQMIRNTHRLHTAIATQDSQLLMISKSDFQLYLRDFHQKKEQFLLNKLVAYAKPQQIQDLIPKIAQIMNSSYLVKYDSQEILFKENQWPAFIYFIIEGEVQIRKQVALKVPKKYLKSQNTGGLDKEVVLKISKSSKDSYVGQAQILMNNKHRQFSAISSMNNSMIFKIDHTAFVKVIGQFTSFQKMMIENADSKQKVFVKNFQKQATKIKKSFLSQYEDYDNKKKEKMLTNFIQQQNQERQMFQIFTQQGIFYRDTFEKLEGFDVIQQNPKKNSSIKRFKVKTNQISSPSKNNFAAPKVDTMDLKKQALDDINKAEKKLFSPKKNMNPLDFVAENSINFLSSSIVEGQYNKQIEINRSKSEKKTVSKNRQYKSVGKFQQIQKDENIYKKVMIKYGLYAQKQDKNIDKSKALKPLIHKDFDGVIKQCISRKNQILKRSPKEKQDEIIIDNYQRTLSDLKNRDPSTIMRLSRATGPCKGTEDLKKKIQSLHKGSSKLNHQLKFKSSNLGDKRIQECIGVNSKPKSSQIYSRSNPDFFLSLQNNFTNIPERITFLNHMMKPITYYNSNSNDI